MEPYNGGDNVPIRQHIPPSKFSSARNELSLLNCWPKDPIEITPQTSQAIAPK